MSTILDVREGLEQISAERRYHEFFRVSVMSAGLYVLAPGAVDKQSQHKEDEIYYLVRGRAQMKIGSRESAVAEGSLIFVEAGTEHRFFDIEEELVLLVVFAPAESR